MSVLRLIQTRECQEKMPLTVNDFSRVHWSCWCHSFLFVILDTHYVVLSLLIVVFSSIFLQGITTRNSKDFPLKRQKLNWRSLSKMKWIWTKTASWRKMRSDRDSTWPQKSTEKKKWWKPWNSTTKVSPPSSVLSLIVNQSSAYWVWWEMQDKTSKISCTLVRWTVHVKGEN